MARALEGDPEFQETVFHVADFESVTPAGYRPEPVEVAVISLRASGGRLTETGRFSALMRPPPHAPVTVFDTAQTGITPQMTASCPPAGEVLAALDRHLDSQGPAVLVAHHAPAEAGIFYDYRGACPRLAATHLLDTVRLARAVRPGLPSYTLDAVLAALGIPRPPSRHRALADAKVTAEAFQLLTAAGAAKGLWGSVRELRRAAGYTARAALPVQETLFG